MMKAIRSARESRKISQRAMAKRAGVSFRTLQLLESGGWDPKISTLQKVLRSLGYPEGIVETRFERLASQDPDSVPVFTEAAALEEDSWKIHLFNFVDRFRSHPDQKLIEEPPSSAVPEKIRALTA